MEQKTLKDLERYLPDKHVSVPVFVGERTKLLLVCISPGVSMTPHRHPGCEVTIQPLLGKAVLPNEDGTQLLLEPGHVYFGNGEREFPIRNPFDEPFQMLVHVVKN